MSIEENKAVVYKMCEYINHKNLTSYYGHLAPDCVFHLTTGDYSVERNKVFYSMLCNGFPDSYATISNVVAEDDRVAFQMNVKGTHKGEFLGVNPTGKQYEITNTFIWKIVSGNVVEGWGTTEIPILIDRLYFNPPVQ